MSEDGFPDVDTEMVKRIAELQREAAVSTKQSLLEEHSASFRWLMASFLALNGGGMLSLKSEETTNAWAIGASICFYVGISCALLIARFGQKAIQAMLVPLSDAIAFWTMVASTGHMPDELREQLEEKLRASTTKSKLPAIAGFISFSAFSAGLIAIMLSK